MDLSTGVPAERWTWERDKSGLLVPCHFKSFPLVFSYSSTYVDEYTSSFPILCIESKHTFTVLEVVGTLFGISYMNSITCSTRKCIFTPIHLTAAGGFFLQNKDALGIFFHKQSFFLSFPKRHCVFPCSYYICKVDQKKPRQQHLKPIFMSALRPCIDQCNMWNHLQKRWSSHPLHIFANVYACVVTLLFSATSGHKHVTKSYTLASILRFMATCYQQFTFS